LSTSSPKHQPSEECEEVQQELSDHKEALTCYVAPKKRQGFRTDREYLEEDEDDQHNLEEWQPDPEIPVLEHEDHANGRSGGWSVSEMFNANDRLGVQTTFAGIEEYST
jgi:hypothetical protein